MAKKNSAKPTKDDNSKKFVNEKKISPEKAMKTKLDRIPKERIPDNEKRNKLKVKNRTGR